MAYPPQYRPTPPPEALRRVSASMEVPGAGYNITDARTGLPPAPAAPAQFPVHPAGGMGPAVPPRMTPQDHRIEEWRRLHFEEGPEAAAAFLRGDKRDPSRPSRLLGKKFLGYKVPKERKKLESKINKASQRVADIQRRIFKAQKELQEASGVPYMQGFSQPPPPPIRAAANRPVRQIPLPLGTPAAANRPVFPQSGPLPQIPGGGFSQGGY